MFQCPAKDSKLAFCSGCPYTVLNLNWNVFHLLGLTVSKLILNIPSLFETIVLNQGYRNRYILIDRLSSSCNFCDFIRVLWFWHIWKIFHQFTKPFKEFDAPHCTCFYNFEFKPAHNNSKIVRSNYLLKLSKMSEKKVLQWIIKI